MAPARWPARTSSAARHSLQPPPRVRDSWRRQYDVSTAPRTGRPTELPVTGRLIQPSLSRVWLSPLQVRRIPPMKATPTTIGKTLYDVGEYAKAIEAYKQALISSRTTLLLTTTWAQPTSRSNKQ